MSILVILELVSQFQIFIKCFISIILLDKLANFSGMIFILGSFVFAQSCIKLKTEIWELVPGYLQECHLSVIVPFTEAISNITGMVFEILQLHAKLSTNKLW